MKNRNLSPPDLQAIARSFLGEIQWQDNETGFCRCPGESRHTHPTHAQDCRVKLDQIPGLFCFHTSCLAEVETANHTFRSLIGKAYAGRKLHYKRHEPTPEERARERQRIAREQLRSRAAASLPQILAQYEISPSDYFELSPVRLTDDPAHDWRLLLRLFKPDDILWIGDKYSSCADDAPESKKEICRLHFRLVAEWLRESEAPAQFTCPSVFKPGTHSRCNEAVLLRRYLVIESDILTKDQICAVINWCRQFMRLRAIVDTGSRSLHGWFDAPLPEFEAELKIILPNLGRGLGDKPTLDPALFKLSQPCRLPGAWRVRGRTRQTLLFLDLEGKQ